MEAHDFSSLPVRLPTMIIKTSWKESMTFERHLGMFEAFRQMHSPDTMVGSCFGVHTNGSLP